ncbi:DUF2975 domain-containing protein [Polaribacter litorisediminis]|uniref:DUF2975 domain-containing protein n=1 Tax=Polaribacter litorisediminis TaxID=1908341 RepID=UPI001CBE92BC|nr:DUF2975 domain-containing protein [Polaribacter litorisediminis]UAM96927.1 DUF2975 domain-containing protein [Polaribacter litorisediminis]
MKTVKILKVMHILSWIVFVGLCIKTGIILTSYFISIARPEYAKNLFEGLDLSQYYTHSFWQYSSIVGYKVLLFSLEAHIAFLVTRLLNTLNLEKPFHESMHQLMTKISISIFYLWILAIIHNAHVQFLAKRYNFSMELFSGDFIFLAGIIFIFAQIIKRGIEIQQENDLTI